MARADAVITETDEAIRQRRHLRLGSGVVALVLVGMAIVLVIRRPGEPRSAKSFCPRIEAASNLNSVLASGDATQIRAAVADLDRAAKVAPPEIEAQLAVMVTYADGLSRAVHGAGDPEVALADAVRAQEDQIPKVEAAGQALATYTRSTCGFTLDQSGSAPATTAPVAGTPVTG